MWVLVLGGMRYLEVPRDGVPSTLLTWCCFSSWSCPRSTAATRTKRRKPQISLAVHPQEVGMLVAALRRGDWPLLAK